MKRLTAVVIAIVVSAPLLALDTRVPAGISPREISIISAMNRERAAYGLPPLRINLELTEAANDRIGDLFENHYFAHVSPQGLQPFVWAERRGYDYRAMGENLATGYSPQEVVDGWMHSPAHRANILGRDFNEVGVAIAPGSPVHAEGGPTVVALYGEQ
jgi:uncharacterized protein YkwD